MILHKPVLLKEVCDYLPAKCELIVDGTLGHGGHTKVMLDLRPTAKVLGIDLDEIMLAKAKDMLKGKEDRVIFQQGSYTKIEDYLEKNGYKGCDYVLVDLGVNLEHFKDGERGFSIKNTAKLDMRYDQAHNPNSAYVVINTYSKTQLEALFMNYADFAPKKATEIAEKIVTQRKSTPLQTTQDLKTLLNSVGLGEKACAVIFQALRIEVNQEINNLSLVLQQIPRILNPGGRCTIISYHSTEDRLVKNVFKELSEQGGFNLLTKKAIQPNYKEKEHNKASRSAKMRVIERSFN